MPHLTPSHKAHTPLTSQLFHYLGLIHDTELIPVGRCRLSPFLFFVTPSVHPASLPSTKRHLDHYLQPTTDSASCRRPAQWRITTSLSAHHTAQSSTGSRVHQALSTGMTVTLDGGGLLTNFSGFRLSHSEWIVGSSMDFWSPKQDFKVPKHKSCTSIKRLKRSKGVPRHRYDNSGWF